MRQKDPDAPELYADYRRRCDEELVPRAVGNCALIFFTLQSLIFIPADWIFFRDHFSLFFPARLALNVLLIWVYLRGARRFPRSSLLIGVLSGAFVFLAMINVTGGPTSGYYAGLILLAIGMGVLLPIPGREGLKIGSIIFAGYAALPLYHDGPVEWSAFIQHLFFLGTAVLEGAFANAYIDRLRFEDYKKHRELEAARDELKELDSAKTRFSANVHHELRTPLTLILAPLDAMRSGDFGSLSGEVKRNLETMYANGRRLLKMINNLLDMAKVESRQFGIHRVALDCERLVYGLVTGARALAERKQISLTMADFETLPEIHADPDAFEKVVVNLLGNALKFTRPGDSIVVKGTAVPGGMRISVRDTGLGIPAENLESIFDRFAQVDSSATRRHEGTGIGLSLARELVDLHGGRIWAESAGEGRGTTMIFELPIGEDDASDEEDVIMGDAGQIHQLGESIEAIASELMDDEHGEDLSQEGTRWERRRVDREEADAHDGDLCETGPEVVVAEDNPDMRSLLRFLLAKEFSVRTARNGREALELVRQRQPTLVLSDVMMPEMSGLDLCREIKNDPALEGLPVVLVTSKAESEMRTEGLEQGADDYVTKPFHPRELLARVRALVSKRQLQQELAERNAALESALTEIRETEVKLVQTERLSAVGELAAGVAHEINNPVNFSLNAARTLEDYVKDLVALKRGGERAPDQAGGKNEVEELSTAIEELVGIISGGLARTHEIVSQLRDFSAPSRGVKTEIDVAAGLRATLDLLRFYLNECSVTVDVQLPEDLPKIRGDAGAINQVFLNLIKNAAEAMAGQGGEIRIEGCLTDDFVQIEFRDQGPGIPDDVRGRLFEPFFTTKNEGEGTGLGLSVCRQIAESHAGRLEVDSKPGDGAAFRLSLPLNGLDQSSDET